MYPRWVQENLLRSSNLNQSWRTRLKID
jgi:hypothetical protein